LINTEAVQQAGDMDHSGERSRRRSNVRSRSVDPACLDQFARQTWITSSLVRAAERMTVATYRASVMSAMVERRRARTGDGVDHY